MNPECPKCGARMVGPRYEQDFGREALRYTCRCGYTELRPTRDAKGRAAVASREPEEGPQP